jgi:hypothetical protein
MNTNKRSIYYDKNTKPSAEQMGDETYPNLESFKH